MELLILALVVSHALCHPPNDWISNRSKRDIEGSGTEETSPLVSIIDDALKKFRADDDPAGLTGLVSTTKPENACKSMQTCMADEECNGGKCFGTFIGKCDCSGCKNFFICQSDTDCGGLKGSCNTQIKLCDCNAGYKNAGFTQFFEALTKFCNQQKARVAQSEEAPTLACTRYQVPGSDFPPRPTKPSIPPGSVNWYQTCLGRIKR